MSLINVIILQIDTFEYIHTYIHIYIIYMYMYVCMYAVSEKKKILVLG